MVPAHALARYLSDICVGPKLALEAMRNIERWGSLGLYLVLVKVIFCFVQWFLRSFLGFSGAF